MPSHNDPTPITHLMTEEALNVCQLLVINPNDLIARTVDSFKEPNEKVSKQRL